MTSAFRDLYLTGDGTLFKAYVLSLALQSTGIFALAAFGSIKLSADPFQWLAASTGGFIFGLSLILSGGCASGTYYRIVEGMVGSLVTAAFYGFGALAARAGILLPLTQRLQSPTTTIGGKTTLYGALGVSPWVLVGALWVVSLFFLWSARRESPEAAWPTPSEAGTSPLWRKLFGSGWSWQATGLGVGLVAVLAWVTSAAIGRNGGLGITSPTANLVRYLLTTTDPKLLDWSVFLILGIPLGSYVAARAAGEFRLRAPSAERLVQHVVGGLGMGLGATVARGCNVGNGLVAVSQFSLNGWVATWAVILGTWAGAYFFLVLPNRRRATIPGSGLAAEGN